MVLDRLASIAGMPISIGDRDVLSHANLQRYGRGEMPPLDNWDTILNALPIDYQPYMKAVDESIRGLFTASPSLVKANYEEFLAKVAHGINSNNTPKPLSDSDFEEARDRLATILLQSLHPKMYNVIEYRRGSGKKIIKWEFPVLKPRQILSLITSYGLIDGKRKTYKQASQALSALHMSEATVAVNAKQAIYKLHSVYSDTFRKFA